MHTWISLTVPVPSLLAGNGKTLRTERAMKAFVQGWITMSGPSSAKAGMQGMCFTLEPGLCHLPSLYRTAAL